HRLIPDMRSSVVPSWRRGEEAAAVSQPCASLKIWLVAALTLAACSPAPPASAPPAPAAANKPSAADAAAPAPAGAAPAPAAAAGAPAPAAAARAPAEVKAGSQQLTGNAGIYIAQERGYFTEQGLDVRYADVGLTSEMIPPLATGQADVVSVGVMSGMFNAI